MQRLVMYGDYRWKRTFFYVYECFIKGVFKVREVVGGELNVQIRESACSCIVAVVWLLRGQMCFSTPRPLTVCSAGLTWPL